MEREQHRERRAGTAATIEGEQRARVVLSRREAMKLGAVAALAASCGVGKPAGMSGQAGAQTFFSAEEFAMVEELGELIIPTDSHSPGAKAAGVAAYIDAQLAEAWEEKDRTDWREGLRRVDGLSQDAYGQPFMQASDDERIQLLAGLAASEDNPERPEDLFFVELKSRVVRGYYTSEIGIKQEMEYKGNTYQTEYAGHDVE